MTPKMPQVTRFEYYRIQVPVVGVPFKVAHARAVAAVHYVFDVLSAKKASMSTIRKERQPDGTFRESSCMSGHQDKEGNLRHLNEHWIKNPVHPEEFLSFDFYTEFAVISKEPLPGYQDPEYRFSRDDLVLARILFPLV